MAAIPPATIECITHATLNKLPLSRDSATNTLAVIDDAQAVALFLRERANWSRHKLRVYTADLRRLVGWCRDRQLGPLSDLTRNDLPAYRDSLCMARATVAVDGCQHAAAPGERAQALAVVASLYQYWFETGYLIASPTAGLVTGTPARTGFSPRRFLPPAAFAACDALMAAVPAGTDDLASLRRRAIRVLYRYGGVRLAELAWSIDTNLPRVEVEDGGQWTLYVHGKSGKPRAIPLPTVAIAPLFATGWHAGCQRNRLRTRCCR